MTPDQIADPPRYVEVVAAVAINDEDYRWREQAALWRGIVERHVGVRFNQDESPYHYPGCSRCYGNPWPCADLLGVVEAAKAYATKELG